MALKTRLVDDLVRIAAAGGGMRLNIGSRLTEDLVRIAAATKSGGGTLFLCGVSSRLTQDLVRIAAAGGGHVVFEDDAP